MHVVTQYPDGVFSWIDLSTSDVEAAKEFYTALFGWEADDLPTDQGTLYTMFQLDGKNVAGGGPMDPNMQQQGVPPFWTSYVKHDDVDAVAARASEAGGTLVLPPMDVMEEGRMAIVQDPTGATVGIWQPRNHIGAQLVNIPNTLVWNELQTPDADAARSFFADVFGWTYDVDENGYVTIVQDGRRHAGMMQIDESWGEVPPNWSIYFLVENLDETVGRVEELGGNILVPQTPAGEMGRFAVVQDPQGGVFSVIEYQVPADPPPGA
jgi:predicted enzyme related to lactoylglutathione lyase